MAADATKTYIDGVAAQLAADGCQVSTELWSGTPVLVGHRSDFRLQWMATTLHLFTIVTPVPAATADVVEGFTDAAMNYALTRKGALRGLQSGIAVFPCVVSENVDPAATVSAQEKQRQYFACMARPVVVDLLRGTIGCYRRNAALGRIYAGHLRRKLDLYFPPITASVDAR
jgi:hypothetical protein